MVALGVDGGDGAIYAFEQFFREFDIGDNAGGVETEDDAVALFGEDVLAVFLFDLRGLAVAVFGLDVREIELFLLFVVEGEIEWRLFEFL